MNMCTFCLKPATDIYEFKTDKHGIYKKGVIKPVCNTHHNHLTQMAY